MNNIENYEYDEKSIPSENSLSSLSSASNYNELIYENTNKPEIISNENNIKNNRKYRTQIEKRELPIYRYDIYKEKTIKTQQNRNNRNNYFDNSNEEFEEFDWKTYINNYNDLNFMVSKNEAWKHWINYGKYENRTYKNVNMINNKEYDDFDWITYVYNYEDLKDLNTKQKAWEHWIHHGINENRVLYKLDLEEKNLYKEKLKNENIQTKSESESNIKNNKLKNENIQTKSELNIKINKLKLKKNYDSYGLHYFGWKGVMHDFLEYYKNNLGRSEFKKNIYFDEWIEKLLLWGDKIENKKFLDSVSKNNGELITFLHNPPFSKYSDPNYKKSIINNVIISDSVQLNNNVIKLIKNNNLTEKIIFFYVLSNDHKKYIYNNYPEYKNKVVSIYHPINQLTLDEKSFNPNEFLKTKKIYHIGWWLRNFKTFIDFRQPFGYEKCILIKNDFINPWNDMIVKNNKLDNITIINELSNEEYKNIFKNSCIFIDLEDCIANNLILECLKFNTPVIVKRLPSIEEYIGKDYPLFYDNKSELKSFKDEIYFLDQINKSYNYLLSFDKSHIDISLFNKKLEYDLTKLMKNNNIYNITWGCIIKNMDESIIDKFNKIIMQNNFNNNYFILFNYHNTHENSYFVNTFIKYYTNKYKNIISLNIDLIENNIIYSKLYDLLIKNSLSDLVYFTELSIIINDEKNLSNKIYDYMNKNVNCDILFLNYGDELKKMYFLDDINKVFSDNCIIWRKNIHKIMGYFENTNDFWRQCIIKNFNVMSSSKF